MRSLQSTVKSTLGSQRATSIREQSISIRFYSAALGTRLAPVLQSANPPSKLTPATRTYSQTAAPVYHNHSPFSTQQPSSPDMSSSSSQRLRRTVHFVPGDNEKFLGKCLSIGADTIILDLEDSVKDKETGRKKVKEFLSTIVPGSDKRSEILVRINPLEGDQDWKADIKAGFAADGFMIPKVDNPRQLEVLNSLLTAMESEASRGDDKIGKKVLLPIATETPEAVLNLQGIAKGPRVVAITWGCEDLSAEIGSVGTRHPKTKEYLDVYKHCRTMCLLAAKAANIQAIDGIYQDIRDMKGFAAESKDAFYMGYDGKLTLHPGQVPLIHDIFTPSPEEFEEAKQIVDLWENSQGKGSLEYKSKMIDLPHYTRAKKTLLRAEANPPKKANGSDSKKNKNDGAKKTDSSSSGKKPEGEKKASSSDSEKPGDFPRVNMGKYFEELEPGMKVNHFLTRTVTEADNVFFTCLSLNPAPIHLDHELSKKNAANLAKAGTAVDPNAGKPLFNSMFTLALLVGMTVPECTHGTTIANLGFSEVVFPKPLYCGDTIRAQTCVVDRRESKSRPTQGIVTLQHLAYNQHGDLVCKATRQALMMRRPAASAAKL